ncbi:hypothetical protein GW17_00038994 [Ensete ventricosum]|nr:hypothetical protein GW17_00038994 [Ensete ventricosum]
MVEPCTIRPANTVSYRVTSLCAFSSDRVLCGAIPYNPKRPHMPYPLPEMPLGCGVNPLSFFHMNHAVDLVMTRANPTSCAHVNAPTDEADAESIKDARAALFHPVLIRKPRKVSR